jgi:Glycosyltransferases, probably involved in cell wall biogenesis
LQLLEIILWLSILVVVYTYGLYPVILVAMPKSKKQPSRDVAMEKLPTVSVVMSVYNEETVLPEKLRNISLLRYPREKIEFIFGSDGSTDRTNEILSRETSQGIKVRQFDVRSGKASVINRLVQEADGEIIVFSDANTIYDPETIIQLVGPFADQGVGGVCGELRLSINKKSVGEIGETSYWQYESVLKRMESDYRTVLGATGGVYAIRKSLF